MKKVKKQPNTEASMNRLSKLIAHQQMLIDNKKGNTKAGQEVAPIPVKEAEMTIAEQHDTRTSLSQSASAAHGLSKPKLDRPRSGVKEQARVHSSKGLRNKQIK
jgi:hypothetical protein